MNEKPLQENRTISELSEEGRVYVQKVYGEQKKIFSRKFGIPENQFPKLRFANTDTTRYSTRSSNITVSGRTTVGEIAEVLGEELAHFVRAKKTDSIGKYIRPSEQHSEEFLGFIGRRLAYQGLPKKKRNLFFPNGAPSLNKVYEPLGETLKHRGAAAIRKKYGVFIRKAEEAKKMGDDSLVKKISNVVHALGFGKDEDIRNRMVIHYRPYKYASKLDLSKVDVPELFELSDKEIRYRYFRDSPVYGGNRKRLPSSRRRGLERIAASLVILISSFCLVFYLKNITGFAIYEKSGSGNAYVALMIAAVFAGIFYIWHSKSYK